MTLFDRLIARVELREPDQVIGGVETPYMRRWYLIPKNRLLNIYLHQIIRSDDDRALHDHPWPSLSYMIRGRLGEVHKHPLTDLVHAARVIEAGQWTFRRASFAHRLVVPEGQEAWTLFITGPHIRAWGFHCPQGWRHWRDFVHPDDPGLPGRGCE